MKGLIYFEDGSVFSGEAIGAKGTVVGELVFNTSMMGYEEILTDPSYAGQIVNMTYPLIGNYGVNPLRRQSQSNCASGMILQSAEGSEALKENLKTLGVIALAGVDTRAVTKKIRRLGACKCVLTTEPLSIKAFETLLQSHVPYRDAMKKVGTQETYRIEGSGLKLGIMDFGIKENILSHFKARGCELVVFPYATRKTEILESGIKGLFLSNGPGDPEMAIEAVETIKGLLGKIPIFGICMGHQLLAKACGAKTYKMHYGHRGGNHGVLDVIKNKAVITSQNHGYAVEVEESGLEDIEVTHLNLNDGTIEGIRHKKHPAFSVQFHPEGAPGPNDSTYLFDDFIQLCSEGGNVCH